jgi:hypothetical protein
MGKVLINVVKCVWVSSLVAAGGILGASYGWEHHGWAGAIELGLVGFGVGASQAPPRCCCNF